MSRADSPLRGRVLFVVGARRSGTNWLERILTAHPAITAMPTETYLFSHGVQPFAERFQHANPAAPSMGRTFMPRDAFLDAMRDFVDRAFLENLERRDRDARFVIERTPWHASHLPLIGHVYPDAHVVNIVRDGRAVARSLVSMPWGPDSIEEAAAEWRDAVDDARRGAAFFGDRYREVVYERLLEDPRPRVSELFEWLGLELDGETWERVLAEAGSEFNVDPRSPGVRADKWRDELSDAELRAFERVAGEQLDSLGYERVAAADGEGDGGGGGPGRRAADRARTLGDPRGALRSARDRAFARRLHTDQIATNLAVSRFEHYVAAGDEARAREFLTPKLWVRVDDGDGPHETRGEAAADELLRALADHRDRGMNILSGHVQASPYGYTTVATYELGDGTRWTRTLAYSARGGKLTGVGLYRARLAG